MTREHIGRAIGAAIAALIIGGTAAYAFAGTEPSGTVSATGTPTATPTETPGDGACTPGYWKNHLDAWSGLTPDTALGDIFLFPAELSSYSDATAEEALSFTGGSGANGAARILLRAAVASVLNAYEFGGDPIAVIDDVNTALATLTRSELIATAAALDAANNATACPLN